MATYPTVLTSGWSQSLKDYIDNDQAPSAMYQFVDYAHGNDSNDGLAKGKAKKTLAAAKAALPGGTNKLGWLHIADGDHHIGTAGNSATGFNQDSGLNVCGVSQLTGPQGGTRIIYDGTGIGWQTGRNSSSIFSGTTLTDVQFVGNDGTQDVLLDVRNAQNNCTLERITCGDTAVGVHNPVTSALRVSVDAGLAGAYPGFIRFRDCWFVGGSVPIDVTAGVTEITFTDCGSDLLDDATIGFRVNASVNDAKCVVRWTRCKQEIHNGPNTSPTPSLVADSTAGQVDAGVHQYAYTYVTPAGESGISLAASVTNDGTHTKTSVVVPLPQNAIADRLTQRKLYRTVAAGSTFKLLATITGVGTTYTDVTPDASLGATYAQGATGTVGNPLPIEIDALVRFDIDSEAFADAFCNATPVISYTASPSGPSWPRGQYVLSSLNYPFHFKGASTALGGGTIPKPAIAANTAHLSGCDFLRTYVVRDIMFGGRAPSIATSGLGTGGTAALTTATFNANDRCGQLAITIGTSPGANPTVTFTFADQPIGNGAPKVILTPATTAAGAGPPTDWTNWVPDYSGTSIGAYRLKWIGGSAPTAANVYTLTYLVIA